GLPGTRRSDQQDASWRRQSSLLIELVMHVGTLDYGIEQPLYLGKTSEGRKRRRAFLNKEFASRAGLDFLQTGEKVVARNLQRPQFSRCGGVALEREGREEAAQGNHADFLTQRFEIGTHEAVGMFGDLLEVDVRRERHGTRVDLEDLQPCLGVRNSDFDFAIEATRTPQSRVKHLGDVGRTDDDDLAARDKAVHQAEKLRHNALFDLADHFGAFGRHSIDLVDEEDRRRVARRFLEDLAELGLALAVELPHNFRAVEVNEVHAAFRR